MGRHFIQLVAVPNVKLPRAFIVGEESQHHPLHAPNLRQLLQALHEVLANALPLISFVDLQFVAENYFNEVENIRKIRKFYSPVDDAPSIVHVCNNNVIITKSHPATSSKLTKTKHGEPDGLAAIISNQEPRPIL